MSLPSLVQALFIILVGAADEPPRREATDESRTACKWEFASILAEKRTGLSRKVKSRWKAATRKLQHRQEVALPEASPSRPGLGCRTT
jgi:hypothetical protein